MADAVPVMPQVSPEELKREIDAGGPVFIVDLRNPEDYNRWQISGRLPVAAVNLPYVEYVEDEERLFAQLPNDRPLTFVCAYGGASDYFARLAQQRGLMARNLSGGMVAWGNFYQTLPVVAQDDLQIWQVIRPARGCLSYVVASGNEAVVIDPLRHTEPYVDFIRQHDWRTVAVLDTHGHADHISGGRFLAAELDAPYYLHPYDAIHPIDVLPATIPYQPLWDGQEFRLGRARLQVLHVPGHTLGNLVYLVNDRYLFSGDSIFVRSIARPDLGGRGETWAPLHYRSLRKLLDRLSPATLVLPGHFSDPQEADADGVFARSLGELVQQNQGLQMVARGETDFVRYILANLPTFPPAYVDIKRANAGLLHPDADQAAELELGRNICALNEAYAD